MRERRVMPSHPDHKPLSRLSSLIAKLTNKHVHWDLKDAPEVETKVLIEDLKDEMQTRMDAGIFGDYLDIHGT